MAAGERCCRVCPVGPAGAAEDALRARGHVCRLTIDPRAALSRVHPLLAIAVVCRARSPVAAAKPSDERPRPNLESVPTLALDWGGVLVTDGSRSAWTALERELGISARESASVWSQLQKPTDLGEIGEDELWRRIALLEPGAQPQEIRHIFLREYQEISFGVEAMCAAADSGWEIALATNNVCSWLDSWRNTFAWFSLIDVICCSSEIGVRKPSGGFYEHLLTLVSDPRPYFVDDKRENVVAAQASGLQAVQATLDYRWPLPVFSGLR